MTVDGSLAPGTGVPKSLRVRIFVDFWNFQLNWNDRAGGRCDWTKLPAVLMGEAAKLLSVAGGTTPTLSLEETLVYASYKPSVEGNLKRWLEGFLNRQPSFQVHVVERRAKLAKIRCVTCGNEVSDCPNCAKPYVQWPEKGVDTALVTDLLSLAWEGAWDVAILVSSDADHVPAVKRLQDKGFKVINATWDGHGFDLAKTSWASFLLNTVADQMRRPMPAPTVVTPSPTSTHP